MKRHPSVLVVGAGSPNADWVAQVLNANGIRASWTDRIKAPDPGYIRKFDIIYGIYLQTCSRYIVVGKLLGKKTVLHFVGSDAYWFAREHSVLRSLYWRLVLNLTDVLLYVSPHLESLIGRRGIIVPFPIAVEDFHKIGLEEMPQRRDILYYCPSGESNEKIYRFDWILDYAEKHPCQKITIIGNKMHPANYHIDLSNVEVVPFVEYDRMPALYKQHKRLIRMTTEDGLPRMIHEALLSGLEVTYNGVEITEVPKERETRNFASTVNTIFKELHPVDT